MTNVKDILDHIDDVPDYSDENAMYHIIASKRASIEVENNKIKSLRVHFYDNDA